MVYFRSITRPCPAERGSFFLITRIIDQNLVMLIDLFSQQSLYAFDKLRPFVML